MKTIILLREVMGEVGGSWDIAKSNGHGFMPIHTIPFDMTGNRGLIFKKLLWFSVVTHRRSLVNLSMIDLFIFGVYFHHELCFIKSPNHKIKMYATLITKFINSQRKIQILLLTQSIPRVDNRWGQCG